MKTNKPEAIVLFGPPGVGKGTAGKAVAAQHTDLLLYAEMGGLLREIATRTSDVARTVADYQRRAELVPDPLVFNALDEYLAIKEASRQYDPGSMVLVLDGMPRSVNQARILNKTHHVAAIVTFDAPKDVVVQRMLGRQRPGETPDVINARYDTYRKTLDTPDFYRRNGTRFFELDARETPEVVRYDLSMIVRDELKRLGYESAAR